ncbi:hypothetical protein, partial [Candidatus Enterovibrio escicola]|uniref:hypothetical protein n=1 Tax=Candidatus Enterovibrio escicola TaxID=1927127 RepID=UPI001CC31413
EMCIRDSSNTKNLSRLSVLYRSVGQQGIISVEISNPVLTFIFMLHRQIVIHQFLFTGMP